MRTVSTVLLLLACAVALAACGDSGSGGTTGTVPTTRVGALGGEHCTVPSVPGFDVTGLDVTGISCAEGQTLAATLVRKGRLDGWQCSTTVSGRRVSGTCRRDGNSGDTISATWQVQ